MCTPTESVWVAIVAAFSSAHFCSACFSFSHALLSASDSRDSLYECHQKRAGKITPKYENANENIQALSETTRVYMGARETMEGE